MGLIYKAISPSGKIYIGKTTRNLECRKKDHLDQISKHNNKFYNALRKYGFEKFKWEIVEDDIPVELLNEKEIFYIEKYNSQICGYNGTSGGDGLNNPSDKTKKLIGSYRKGKTYEQIYGEETAKIVKEKISIISKKQKGKVLSEETKKKISNTLIANKEKKGHNIPHSEEAKKKISENKERAKKISLALKGKPKSKEHKEKIINLLKSRKPPNLGRKFSEAHKKALSEAHKKRN